MMSQPTPFGPQSVLQWPDASLDQWQDTQRRTLDYLGNLVSLSVKGYQDTWRLGTAWMLQLSPLPDFSSASTGLESAVNYRARAQRVAFDRLGEMERLHREWWSNVFAATAAPSRLRIPAPHAPERRRPSQAKALSGPQGLL